MQLVRTKLERARISRGDATDLRAQAPLGGVIQLPDGGIEGAGQGRGIAAGLRADPLDAGDGRSDGSKPGWRVRRKCEA